MVERPPGAADAVRLPRRERACSQRGSTTGRRPRIDEALSALSDGGEEARPLAGGQSLIPMMKLRFAAPSMLVDLQHVPGLDGIEEANGHLSVGAMARTKALEAGADQAAYRRWPRRRPRSPTRWCATWHARRLARPRRPVGRLGIGDARARRRGRAEEPSGERTMPVEEFLVTPSPPRSSRARSSPRSGSPGPAARRRLLHQAGAQGGTRHRRRRRTLELEDDGTIGQAGIASDRSRPEEPQGDGGRANAGRRRAERRGVRGGRPAGARRPPTRPATCAAARSTTRGGARLRATRLRACARARRRRAEEERDGDHVTVNGDRAHGGRRAAAAAGRPDPRRAAA